MKIQISTDSTADVSKELQKELDISVLPLTITYNDVDYKDGVDISEQEFYKILSECETLPTTCAISPYEYTEYFEKLWKNGVTDLIHVSINSKGSSTYQNALIGKKTFFGENPEAESQMNITIIDSLNYSQGYGLGVIQAAKMAKENKTPDEIVDFINDWVANVKVVFIPLELKCVKKSGRISAAAAFMGDAIGLKPIIVFKDGEAVIPNKVRGEQKAVDFLVETLKQERKSGTAYSLAFAGNLDAYEKYKTKVYSDIDEKPTCEFPLGSIIATNTGPNAIGLVFYEDK